MNMPYQTRVALEDCFNPDLSRGAFMRIVSTRLNSNPSQKAFIINPKTNVEFFIPTFALTKILNRIGPLISMGVGIESTYLYKLIIGYEGNKTSVDAASKILFKGSYESRVVKVSVGKTAIINYLGMKGALFDENWNPLVVCGYNAFADGQQRLITLTRPVCYIHPKVFMDDTAMNRFIMKKALPIFIEYTGTNRAISSFNSVNFSSNRDSNTKILVEDASHMIYTPRKPDINTERDINKLLVTRSYAEC